MRFNTNTTKSEKTPQNRLKHKEKHFRRICMRCRKLIGDKENYYAFTEYKNKKIINIDYAHRECWDDFLKQIGNVDEAMSMLRRIKAPLQKMGILGPEEVEIK